MSDVVRSESPFLAVDAGQSSTRVRCEPGPWGPGWMVTSSGVRTALPLAPQFAAVMANVVAKHPEVTGSHCTVAIGSSGARDDEAPGGIRRQDRQRVADPETSRRGGLDHAEPVFPRCGPAITMARPEIRRPDGNPASSCRPSLAWMVVPGKEPVVRTGASPQKTWKETPARKLFSSVPLKLARSMLPNLLSQYWKPMKTSTRFGWS